MTALYDTLNKAENALGRAMHAARKRDFAKVRRDTETGIAHAQAALAMLEEPAPTPTPAPVPTPTPTPVPTPTPTPHEPPAAGWVRADSIVPIASNFDINKWLTNAPLPPSAKPDILGAFRFTANMSHLSYDDPVVWFGQPGKAHLHHFFGNTLTDAHSTYESLRASGRGIYDGGDMLNRSAYWFPAMLDGKGSVVCPDFTEVYYKQIPSTSPLNPGIGVNIPAGLKMVFGNNYPPEEVGKGSRPVEFKLWRNGDWVLQGQSTLTNVLQQAQVGDFVFCVLTAPDCWDGVHIDSPDHRSHMAYQVRDSNTGQMRTPASHPYIIPLIQEIAAFAVLPGDTPKTWHYSSDTDLPGKSFHGDYIAAWDPLVQEMWFENAIEKLLNCSAGELGNGKQGKKHPGFTFAQRPHLIPVP